ncbi:DMT family transporter [Geodermatophilus sp. SYSU D00758]
MAVYLLAVGAGLLFAVGSVVQQRVASVAPPGKSLRFGLLLWLVRQPAWLVGVGTAVVGNLFSGAALGMGSVAIVQPLLVSRLLFAIPLSAAWARQRITGRDWLGMVATAGGLATFLLVGRPEPSDGEDPAVWQWLVVAGAIGAVTGALVLTARRLAPAREAPMLGAGAGMLFALQSGFTHTAVSRFLDEGLGGLLAEWTTYAVAVTAVLGTLLAQSAYQMAPLAASYPALAAVEPLAAIAIGVGVLGTALAVGVLPVTVFVLALAVMTAGIWLLATSELVTGQRETMERRRAEEVVAELERDLDHRLDHLAEAVRGLETRGARTPERAVRRVDELVGQVDRLLGRLAGCHREAEEDRATDAAAAGHPPSDELDRVLDRYAEENRHREERLRSRAAELRARAAAAREAVRRTG